MAGLIVIAQQRRRSTIKRSGFPYTWSRWAGTAILLLAVGVLRRWRWTFWLILVAFLAGGSACASCDLQLVDALPTDVPSWYVVLQALIGLVQAAIGLAMVIGYRRSGVWGAS